MREKGFLRRKDDQRSTDEHEPTEPILTTPGSVGAAGAPLPEADEDPAAGTGPACCDTIDDRPAGLAPFI